MAKTNWQERQVSLAGSVAVAAVTLVLGVFAGMHWEQLTAQFLPLFGIKTSAEIDWSELNEVYGALSSDYNGELDQETLIEGAKKGMVAALDDPYTVYMTAEEYNEFEKDLHGEVGAGIGIEMGERDGYVRVIRTLPDNPAREAGVLAGDIIYKVEGEEVYNLTNEEIASRLKGEPGTEVTFSVVRDGEELEFTVTREEINNVSAYANYDGDTAIVNITRFDTDTGEILSDIADEIEARGIQKIVLDLRGNGGGYVSAAKDIASLWIDGDLVVTQKSLKTGNTSTYANKGQARLADRKTVVLVDSTTASASEILAGALQDYGKATVVGSQTYGKGVVQTLLNLSAGSVLKVTTASWYTPNGNSINEVGITPDIVVENSFDDTNAGRDPQMDAARAELNS